MASRLTDKVFFNSVVTLTSKFQSQMIHCLCLKYTGPDLHETKAMWINWLIYFIYDLGHWPCPWPWPWISKVKFWNCHIYKLSDLIVKNKDGCILWMVWYFVNNISSTLCFHRMLQCRSGLTFLSLATSVRSYLYRNGDCPYLGHNTCWVLFWASLHIHIDHGCNSQSFV